MDEYRICLNNYFNNIFLFIIWDIKVCYVPGNATIYLDIKVKKNIVNSKNVCK